MSESGAKRAQPWPALLFCLLLSLACLGLALFSIKQSSAASIPISLHSELTANYNADPPSALFPEFQLDIIKDVIHSEAANASEVPERVSNLEDTLKTPVPMVTPLPTSVIINPPTAPAQPSLIPPLPTATLLPTKAFPTTTGRPTKKPKPTDSPPIATRTPKHKTKTPKETATLSPPIATSLPKHTKKPKNALPTSTPQPAQSTATFTPRPAQSTATFTSQPIQSTPTFTPRPIQSTATLPGLPTGLPNITNTPMLKTQTPNPTPTFPSLPTLIATLLPTLTLPPIVLTLIS